MAHPVTPLGKQDVDPIPGWMQPIVHYAMKWYSRWNVWAYQRTNGRWGGKFPVTGAPVVLVTMRGRKTGKARTIPLIYIPHGEDVILGASQGGMDQHPVWYRNLLANPEVEVNAYGVRRHMIARQASAEEKAAVWPVMRAVYPPFDEYQARTDRDIPVMICSPVKD